MKKTIIGMMIMAVAIMMTLSSAVFAANTVTATVSGEAKVGEAVTVTVNHPGVSAGQYTVKYNPDVLTYTGSDNAKNGEISVVFMDLAQKEVASHALTFTAKAVGESKIEISGVKLSDTKGDKITDATVEGTTVKVVEVKAEEPAPAPENNAPANNTPAANNNNSNGTATNGEKELTTLKETKTGFDAMYVVYLAAAVVVAGGIVRVATKR